MANVANPKIVLIGGASHVGKSTLCAALAAFPGWSSLSTDMLGRHPGRPWKRPGKPVPEHVSEHYLSLSAEELAEDLLRHQRRMWPTIEQIITHRLTAAAALPRLAFEGSALLPDNAGNLQNERVKYLFLAAAPEFLQQRIHVSSGYKSLADAERRLVNKFLDRNRLLNERYIEMANLHGVPVIDVGTGISTNELVALSVS